MNNPTNTFQATLDRHQAVVDRLRECEQSARACCDAIQSSLVNGGKLLLFGNGGSAADCQHIAAEFVVRYKSDRQALPALALTTDTSILTAAANDFSFDETFRRQVQALATRKDVAVGLSTSGKSPNVLAGLNAARSVGATTILLTGSGGREEANAFDHALVVPSSETARIQEAHLLFGHWVCEHIDAAIAEAGNGQW